ncbi:UNVERIFIED_CONTAM: hypothetical protein RKD43_006267 [Streptomyces graminofaciens]
MPVLERAGWTLHVAADDNRGRIEAFHPDGAIAMRVRYRPTVNSQDRSIAVPISQKG